MRRSEKELPTIGWREWIGLPGLGVKSIKAKIDTGALTSALHAFQIERFRREGRDYVRFFVHPRQKTAKSVIQTEAPLLGMRSVRSSNGHQSERPVIATEIQVYDQTCLIQLTLANRDQMGFRMLLGREALRNRFLVDAARSYCDPSRIPKRRKQA